MDNVLESCVFSIDPIDPIDSRVSTQGMAIWQK
jgi:hypothetical protein